MLACRAFGYNQVLGGDPLRLNGQLQPPLQVGGRLHTAAWNSSALVGDPQAQEFHILENVVEGAWGGAETLQVQVQEAQGVHILKLARRRLAMCAMLVTHQMCGHAVFHPGW